MLLRPFKNKGHIANITTIVFKGIVTNFAAKTF